MCILKCIKRKERCWIYLLRRCISLIFLLVGDAKPYALPALRSEIEVNKHNCFVISWNKRHKWKTNLKNLRK